MKKQNGLSNSWFSFMLPVQWLLKRQRKLGWVFSQEWARPAVVSFKCKGCWWELSMNSVRKERLQSTSCHCSQSKNVLIQGVGKVWLPTCSASVNTTMKVIWLWRIINHGWLFFPDFVLHLRMYTSTQWKFCLYILLWTYLWQSSFQIYVAFQKHLLPLSS